MQVPEINEGPYRHVHQFEMAFLAADFYLFFAESVTSG
jgi:hypothetical protein